MRISLTRCFCVAMLSLAVAGLTSITAQKGEWKNTIAAVVMDGSLYTVEKDGRLYITDLNSGTWRPLGKPEFGKTRFLFAGGKNLLSIEQDGSLYRINPSDGSWTQVGEAGAWKNTLAGAVLNGRLFTAEPSGILYATNPATGAYAQLGKADFAKTQRMFAADTGLFSIESDGSLYSINPADGSWRQLGEAGGWKDTIARATLNGKIYTIESSGALYETNAATGVWKQIGKPEFAKTRFLVGGNGSLFSIEDGFLYKINPSTGTWVAVGK